MNREPGYQFQRVSFLITRLCNLRCRMCDYRIHNFFTKMISPDKIKSVIREISDLGAETLELSGGEPMVRKDIYEIIHYASSLHLKVHLMTNGVLIGEKEAKQLIESGLKAVSVSLEGPEELNDQIRGAGNYQKTINAIKYFEKYKGQVQKFTTVGITLSKYNYSHIHSFAKFLLEEIGVSGVTINPFESLMLKEENRIIRQNEFLIDTELMDDFLEELEKIIEYSETMEDRMPSPSFLKRIPDYFLGKRIIPERGCFIPLTTCAIHINGEVSPCWKTSSVGNLNETSLKEILNSPPYRNFAQDALNSKCGGCLTSCYDEVY